MGIALSLPFLAVPSLAGLSGWALSCCGAAAVSGLCRMCGTCSSSIATRVAYALLLLVNSLLSWVMLSGWAIKQIERITLNYMQITCPTGGKCYGVLAVHRINFALGMFHLGLALLLLGVRSTRNRRSSIQNGWWGPKLVAWALLIVLSFFIPNGFFVFWSKYIAIPGSIIFIFFGLILLVDMAHEWAEKCLENYEESESKTWQTLLVGSTLGMFVVTIVLTVLMFVFFARSGCGLNKAIISVNLVLAVISTLMSIHPAVQEHNPRSGLAQAGMVGAYATYLIMSAVANEPNDKQCNPLVRSGGARTVAVVIGAVFTFLAIAYSTTRAATQTSSLGNRRGQEYEALEPDADYHSLITSEPSSRAAMRAEALQRAVESGGLPASALDDDLDDESDDDNEQDDERAAVRYHYSVFHVIFFLATCYTALLLTNWGTMKIEDEDNERFVVIGRNYANVWLKVVSSWVCYALYVWSLIAPAVMPDRF